MITINLFNYRQELVKIEIQKRVLAVLGILLVAVVLCGFNWFIENGRVNSLKSDIEDLDGQVKGLAPKVKAVKQMKTKNERLAQILKGINKLRSGQIMTTHMLDDINQQLPDGVWLKSVQQMGWPDLKKRKVPIIFIKNPAKVKKKRGRKKKKREVPDEFVEIKGQSFSDSQVAKFVSDLEKVPYFNTVFLHRLVESTSNGVTTRAFTLYCYMGKPKSKA